MGNIFSQQEASHKMLDRASLATVGSQYKGIHSPLCTQLIEGANVGIPGSE